MGIRVKLLRNQHGYSLEQLAQRSGLTKSYLSKVERGVANPSVSASLKIANALNVDVADLFERPQQDDLICVVRQKQGMRLGENKGQQVVDLLATEMANKTMQPFIISPPAEFAQQPPLKGHPGEEFLLVINGSIEIQFPDRTELLHQGDSVYFRANIPHLLRRCSEQPASALVIIANGNQ